MEMKELLITVGDIVNILVLALKIRTKLYFCSAITSIDGVFL